MPFGLSGERTTAQYRSGAFAGFVVKVEVCETTDSSWHGNTKHAGWIAGCKAHSGGQIRTGVVSESRDCLIEADDAACKNTRLRRTTSVLYEHWSFSQLVSSVRHPGGLERVCDEDGSIGSLRLEPQADHLRSYVHPVADEVCV